MDLNKTLNRSGKKDARSPDVVTAELKKGFEWTTQHTRLVVGVIAAVLLVGAGLVGWNYFDRQSEEALQAQYFDLETQVLKKKEAFEAAQAPQPPGMAADKAKKPEGPTGDFAKDYVDLPQKLKDFALAHPRSKAGAMAALTLAGLQAQYKESEAALEVLKNIHTRGLLGSLVKMQMATLLANTGKCDEAVPLFHQLASDPGAAFMKLEAKLKVAVCAISSGNTGEAEKQLQQIVAEGKESSTTRSAQKYLRLLQSRAGSEVKTN